MANSSKLRTDVWRLSIRQILLLIAVFAVAFAVWMHRLHDASREDLLFQATTRASMEARKLNLELLEAVRAKDSATVGKLLKAGADANWADAKPGPLKIAIRNADIESVKLLIAAGASVDGHAHESPLVIANFAPIEQHHKVMIFRELLEHGANVARDQLGMDVCYGSRSPEIVAMLRQQGAPYGPREMALTGDIVGLRAALATDRDLLGRPLATYCMSSKTLLGVALRHGHEDLANWMLDEGAPLEVHEVSRGTALHMAAVGDCARVIPRLCQMGCDPNAGDDTGETPLDYCLASASPLTVEALIACGAEVNTAVPRVGNTLLHRAVLRYDAENESNPCNGPTLQIITLLLHAGANPDIADAEGRSARDLACKRGSAILECFDRH